jgi:hypothetical protein
MSPQRNVRNNHRGQMINKLTNEIVGNPNKETPPFLNNMEKAPGISHPLFKISVSGSGYSLVTNR